MPVYSLDLEADGLLESITKIWCVVVNDGQRQHVMTSKQQFVEWLSSIADWSCIYWHNLFGYDLEAMRLVWGLEYDYRSINGKPLNLIDTLALSRSLNPDRDGHGLDEWGKRLGVKKPVVTDWKSLKLDEYIYRCTEDTRIQHELNIALAKEGGFAVGGKLPFNLQLSNIDYYLMCEQERNGVTFDVELAKSLVTKIGKRMAEIEAEVEPKLPTKKPNKGETKELTPPKQQFKKDGTPSATCEKWFDKLEEIDGVWYGTKDGVRVKLPHNKPIKDEIPMRLKHQGNMKEWLMSLGWKPTIWNYKKVKDKHGKLRFVRDDKGELIKTSPKFHHQGELCPNLELLGNKVELVRPVIEWLSLRNRRSVLLNEEKGTGWLNHPRLQVDGKLPPAHSGLANTHRKKHTVVANIPRVGSLLGEEFRSLFKASEGRVFVGYDASGLEARIEGHYTAKFDGGTYAEDLLKGDVHTTNAFVFFGDEVELGEDGRAKPQWRKPSKNGKYALTYGAQPPALSNTLGIPLGKAKEVFDNFWETNWPLKKVIEELETEWNNNGQRCIKTIDGSLVWTRAKHSLCNALFQSTGAKIMDLAGVFMAKWIREKNIDANRVVYYHDEYIWECWPEDAKLVAELGVKSIIEAGKFFKLRVPLDADAKIGYTWAEVH
jgi:hypothetical protein